MVLHDVVKICGLVRHQVVGEGRALARDRCRHAMGCKDFPQALLHLPTEFLDVRIHAGTIREKVFDGANRRRHPHGVPVVGASYKRPLRRVLVDDVVHVLTLPADDREREAVSDRLAIRHEVWCYAGDLAVAAECMPETAALATPLPG